jgi:hypothetical protein
MLLALVKSVDARKVWKRRHDALMQDSLRQLEELRAENALILLGAELKHGIFFETSRTKRVHYSTKEVLAWLHRKSLEAKHDSNATDTRLPGTVLPSLSCKPAHTA